jgi:hypothetical protein
MATICIRCKKVHANYKEEMDCLSKTIEQNFHKTINFKDSRNK